MPPPGADAFDHDADAFVALRLEAIRARQIGCAAAAEQENVARAAERLRNVALVDGHLGADEASVAAVLVIRLDGLAVLVEIDKLVAQLETERSAWRWHGQKCTRKVNT